MSIKLFRAAFFAQAAFGSNAWASNSDGNWMLASGLWLLFAAGPGLALFYAGLVRSKNVLSVVTQNYAVISLGSLVWLFAGHNLAFYHEESWKEALAWPLGLNAAAMHGGVPESVFAIYHMGLALLALALIVGGLAERMRFRSLPAFASLWLLSVYAPICHWLWGGGWLERMGAMDFAGGAVVQIPGGVAALTCALMLGPRKGFPRLPMPPHNLPLTALGAGLLWIGWHGFIAGAASSANGSAGMAMLTTHFASSTAALAWLLMEYRRYGKCTLLGLLTGVVSGLAAISPAAGFVGPAGAMAIGASASAICFYTIRVIKHRMHIDDALDVFSVNSAAATVGILLTGIFASKSLGGAGLRAEGGIPGQLAVQTLVLAISMAWSGLASYGLLKLLNLWMPLRVDPDEETEGLDISQHGESSYPP